MSQPGDWVWSLDHCQVGRVVETRDLWGAEHCHVWIPLTGALARVRGDRLRPATKAVATNVAWHSYVAAAGRVGDALTQDTLLAPVESSVIPLPHQIRALARATREAASATCWQTKWAWGRPSKRGLSCAS